MPTTRIATIPGSLDTKFVDVELGQEDACTACGSFPTYGLYLACGRCMRPVCDHCTVQAFDEAYCPDCARAVLARQQGTE